MTRVYRTGLRSAELSNHEEEGNIIVSSLTTLVLKWFCPLTKTQHEQSSHAGLKKTHTQMKLLSLIIIISLSLLLSYYNP